MRPSRIAASFSSRVGDDDDRVLAAQKRACPGGVLTAEADVDAAWQVPGGEIRRVAHVEHLRADRLHRQTWSSESGLSSRASDSSSVGRSFEFSTAS